MTKDHYHVSRYSSSFRPAARAAGTGACFYKIFAKFPRILLNFDQILTKCFRDFSKMQHFSENYWKKRFPAGKRANGPKKGERANGQTKSNARKRVRAKLQIWNRRPGRHLLGPRHLLSAPRIRDRSGRAADGEYQQGRDEDRRLRAHARARLELMFLLAFSLTSG